MGPALSLIFFPLCRREPFVIASRFLLVGRERARNEIPFLVTQVGLRVLVVAENVGELRGVGLELEKGDLLHP